MFTLGKKQNDELTNKQSPYVIKLSLTQKVLGKIVSCDDFKLYPSNVYDFNTAFQTWEYIKIYGRQAWNNRVLESLYVLYAYNIIIYLLLNKHFNEYIVLLKKYHK